MLQKLKENMSKELEIEGNYLNIIKAIYIKPIIDIIGVFFVVVVQLLSHVWLFVTSWTAAWQATLYYILEFVHIHVYWIDDAI